MNRPDQSRFEQPRSVNAVLYGLKASTLPQVYQAIAAETAAKTGLDTEYLYGKLMDLEEGASSGVGGGVAIPHLRLKGAERPFTLLARLNGLVDFKSVDGEPVDLVMLILSPAADVADHLRRLAKMSRLMRDESLCAKLRGVETTDGMHALLIDRQTENLAA